MAKILCPNKEYNGISASVTFVNGVGETNNLQLIEWFKSHGYTVEEDAEKDKSSSEKPKNRRKKTE